MSIAEAGVMPDSVEATLNYLLDNGEKPVTYVGVPGVSDVRSSGTPDPRVVSLRNGRNERFTLDRNGFRFVHHDTKVTSFFDEDEVRRVYYPEMEALVKQESGASRVVRSSTANDHLLSLKTSLPSRTRKRPLTSSVKAKL